MDRLPARESNNMAMTWRRVLLACLLIVGVSAPAQAAIGYLTNGHRSDSLGANGGTSGTFDSTGGNLIVLTVAMDISATMVGGDITDNKGNTTWVSHGAYATGFPRVQIFSHTAPSVGTGHTITVTKTGSYSAIAIATFSGVHATTPFDLIDGGTATAYTVSPTTGITPSANNALIISGLTVAADWGFLTDPTGFTRTDAQAFSGGVSYGAAMAYKIQGAASAEDPEWTVGNSIEMATAVASFLEATGGAVKKLLLMGVGQ